MRASHGALRASGFVDVQKDAATYARRLGRAVDATAMLSWWSHDAVMASSTDSWAVPAGVRVPRFHAGADVGGGAMAAAARPRRDHDRARADGAGWRADTVDQVALIGGSALVPMFQRVVAGVFPARGVTLAPRADVAVAVGTVLLTARFGGATRRPGARRRRLTGSAVPAAPSRRRPVQPECPRHIATAAATAASLSQPGPATGRSGQWPGTAGTPPAHCDRRSDSSIAVATSAGDRLPAARPGRSGRWPGTAPVPRSRPAAARRRPITGQELQGAG